MKKKKAKRITVTLTITFDAVDGNVLNNAVNAENSLADLVHDWMSDSVEDFDLDTESTES